MDVVPEVSESALRNFKFSELLPRELAVRTLALRGADQAVGSRTLGLRSGLHDLADPGAVLTALRGQNSKLAKEPGGGRPRANLLQFLA